MQGNGSPESSPLLLKGGGEGKAPKGEGGLKGCQRFIGSLCAALSGGFDALTSAIMQLIAYDPITGSLWRFILMLGMMSPLFLCSLCSSSRSSRSNIFQPVWPVNYTTFLLLAIAHSNGQTLVLFALEKLMVGDVMVILASGPIFVNIQAHFFLGETSGVVPYLLAVMSLVGAAVVSRPSFILAGTLSSKTGDENDALWGTLLSFGAMLCFSSLFIILRHLRNVDHILTTFSFCLWGFFELSIISYFLQGIKIPDNLHSILYLIAAAFFSLAARTCVIIALKLEQPGRVALNQTMKVIFAFTFQFIFFGVPPDGYSLVGGGLVLCSVIIMGIRKIREAPGELSESTNTTATNESGAGPLKSSIEQ